MDDRTTAMLCLMGTIVLASVANTVLKQTQGFTRPIPVVIALCIMIVSFACKSQVMLYFPVGLVYTIFASSVIVLVNILAYVMYHQVPTSRTILGTLVILLGIGIINS